MAGKKVVIKKKSHLHTNPSSVSMTEVYARKANLGEEAGLQRVGSRT